MFNEHQKRLWISMIATIDRYYSNRITLADLVSNLHGAFQAGDFADKELIKKWYHYWGSLEIHNAVLLDKGKISNKQAIIDDINLMKNFLENEIKM